MKRRILAITKGVLGKATLSGATAGFFYRAYTFGGSQLSTLAQAHENTNFTFSSFWFYVLSTEARPVIAEGMKESARESLLWGFLFLFSAALFKKCYFRNATKIENGISEQDKVDYKALRIMVAEQERQRISMLLNQQDPPYHELDAKEEKYYLSTDEVPSKLICPITLEVMREPVYVEHDRCSYERHALQTWYDQKMHKDQEDFPVCPISRDKRLSNPKYMPLNEALKTQIFLYIEKRKKLESSVQEEGLFVDAVSEFKMR